MVIGEAFEPHIGWLPVMVRWKQLMMKFFLEFFPQDFFNLLIYYDFLKQTYFSYFFRCAKVRTVCNGYSCLNCSVSVHVRTAYAFCTYCRVTSKRSCRRSVSFFLYVHTQRKWRCRRMHRHKKASTSMSPGRHPNFTYVDVYCPVFNTQKLHQGFFPQCRNDRYSVDAFWYSSRRPTSVVVTLHNSRLIQPCRASLRKLRVSQI